ncbi:MAG: phage virion morphogenesis protein [Burkholderiales bacterium]|nr:phage virion morphogenesis protein [Burkholderiales bacterium]
MSADPLQQLEDWVAPLLGKLTESEQRQLARRIATDLRRSQSARIARQRNPDGSAFEPRKPQRQRRGKVKAMFAQLRTARFLRTQATSAEAVIAIAGRAARIARVHQDGLRDQVTPGGPSVIYPRRALLGLTQAEREAIKDTLLTHLGT